MSQIATGTLRKSSIVSVFGRSIPIHEAIDAVIVAVLLLDAAHVSCRRESSCTDTASVCSTWRYSSPKDWQEIPRLSLRITVLPSNEVVLKADAPRYAGSLTGGRDCPLPVYGCGSSTVRIILQSSTAQTSNPSGLVLETCRCEATFRYAKGHVGPAQELRRYLTPSRLLRSGHLSVVLSKPVTYPSSSCSSLFINSIIINEFY